LIEKIRSLFIYLLAFFFLMLILAIIDPSQFQIIADLFSESTRLLSVLFVIAILIFILKKAERL